jgi:hypothetical protein
MKKMNKPKNRFYNFTMLRVIPAVLKRWNSFSDLGAIPGRDSLELDVKWHWERKEYYMWYKHQILKLWEKPDWIGVIICAMICFSLKEKSK